ncbi:MAG: anhydro-N-acetylmuramic acid kinase [Chitinophagaceae bacterium]|nr:anhydro-N-acetylmuramic acid kinase [Chitinophagaceae bacterium]
MIYRAIGLMSGSSLDGLDIAFASFRQENGSWKFDLTHAACYPYNSYWQHRLKSATTLSAQDYLMLHAEYGHYLGKQVNRFIEENQLHFQVSLIASHGHTTFHNPSGMMTAQLGDGAAIAARTGLPVVSDLRALDVALGGQGAPIVPIGEKLLLGDYDAYLNLGGIANITVNAERFIAFDVCPANRVLNMLAGEAGMEFDESGNLAASGTLHIECLQELNRLEYYQKPYPKSLANEFGTDVVFPLVIKFCARPADALRTYTEHIVLQIGRSLQQIIPFTNRKKRLLVTGGGAHNTFLISRLKEHLSKADIETVVPDARIIDYKEALIMAFIGVLRWRQEYTVLASVTGASRNSIGGALWLGQEA